MTELVTSPQAAIAAHPKYQRVVITTKRKTELAAPAEVKLSADDVKALSKAKKDPAWLAKRRLAAWKLYQSTPMPTLDDEAWRRTDIRPFKWNEVELSALNGRVKARAVPAALLKPLAGKEQGGQLVVNAGRAKTRTLAPALKRKGVIFTDFQTAAVKHAALVKRFIGQAVRAEEGKFAAMAEALMDGGVFLYVPKNVEVSLPLHSIVAIPGKSHFTRLLIVLDDGASATYVHEVTSPEGKADSLHASIVELIVGQKANLKFVELQSLGLNAWNFTHERARLYKDAKLDWVFNAVGSHLTKNFSEIDLDGEGASARMSGFYFAEKDQNLDHDTQQNHNVPNTTSDLLFKGALRDKSRSVWQGMIYVAPGAQKTDGYQANRNLVLSKAARADSIPGLEIMADDVRCTHGATVGQLDQEHIFYLMSRGMPRPEAEKLVVDGFFDPIMQRIPFDGVVARLKKDIERKMSESGWGE
ncbi:MAG TPA: Fe-S cluster assembly protein SufD [Anaerolineales bacterium]|nr:Fe-S cluster assembly protein SufD [Anaerolineales bacterium]